MPASRPPHRPHLRAALLTIAASTLTMLGCGGADGSEALVESALRQQISTHGLTGDPMTGRTVPSPTSPLAKLGARLFFSKTLGGDRDSACVSCHHPLLGGGDNLPLPIGVASTTPDKLGPGRIHSVTGHDYDGGPTVPRNAPTTFNIVGWDKVLFFDGRVESLVKTKGAHGTGGGIRTPDSTFGVADPQAGTNLSWAQARFPVTSKEEMKGFEHNNLNNQGIRDLLAGRLGGFGTDAALLKDTGYWLQQFRDGFASPAGTAATLITEQNIAQALAAYQQSQALTDTPWKKYVKGDTTAISSQAKAGALLFFMPVNQGGAGCASCHSGDFFTDEDFYNIGVPQIGRGKGDGTDGHLDFGRFRETKQEKDKFAFRVPTLLNVEVTGPWGHAGSFATLEATVRHHFDPVREVMKFDASQVTQPGVRGLDMSLTQPALYALTVARIQGQQGLIPELPFGDVEVDNLVAFLKTLTDPCTKSRDCMSKWIPDPVNGVDPNGDHLDAVLPPGTP